MKRNSMAALLAAAFILGATAAIAAPVDLSIGGTAWYIWWKPAWADAKTYSVVYNDRPILFIEDSHDFKPPSNVMAGPVISISFLNRWSIQSVFTIGKFHARASGSSVDKMYGLTASDFGVSPSYKKYTRDIIKWDSDTSIGCAVHRMVKIFAGFKSQGYRYDEVLNDILYDSNPIIIRRKLTDDVRAYGGGVGIGLTFPLGNDFYLMMGASGLALWSFESININRSNSFVLDPSANGPLPIFPHKGRYFSYGGSASLSLAYNIEKINTSLSIGGRYQLLFNRQRYGYRSLLYNDVAMNIIDRQYDHFFGITLSAMYTFHIGKKA